MQLISFESTQKVSEIDLKVATQFFPLLLFENNFFFPTCSKESALIPDVVNLLQWTIKTNGIIEILEHKRDFIDRRPLREGNLLWASSIQNNSLMLSLSSTHTYILSLIQTIITPRECGINRYLYTKPNLKNYYSRWIWDDTIYSQDDLQSICVQQKYTNEVKRRVDTVS